MADFNFLQTQKQVQTQSQILSQRQIQLLNLIGMNSLELRDEIYSAADRNPALEITKDAFLEGTKGVKRSHTDRRISTVRTGKTGARGKEEADAFQKILESAPDETETLQEHLKAQLNMMNDARLSKEQQSFCLKLIENLDENGHHFLAPESLLEKGNPLHTPEFLKKALTVVQNLDPAGCGTKDFQESLLVQAKGKIGEHRDEASSLVLFILNGHLDLISPPEAEKAVKKMAKFAKEQEKLSFLKPEEILDKSLISEENAEHAISFIKALNPFPASSFGKKQTQFVQSDAIVSIEEGELEHEDFERGLITGVDIKGNKKASDEKREMPAEEEHEMQADKEPVSFQAPSHFRVRLLKDSVPSVALSDSFSKTEEDFNGLKKQAVSFLELLEIRDRALLKTFSTLVSLQKEFFVYGPEKLRPLTRKQLAEITGVHESTISRFADSKYIRTDFGTFPVKYFFSSGVKSVAKEKKLPKEENTASAGAISPARQDSTTETVSSAETVSSSVVKIEIKKILEENKNQQKKLSDQKIADILNERGIKIARRTVAKYRDQLNIESSYGR